MKKYILLLTCLLFTLPTFAIKFDGIEIKGKGEDFVRALKAKGYKLTTPKRIEPDDIYEYATWDLERNILGKKNYLVISTNPVNDRILRLGMSSFGYTQEELDKTHDVILESMIEEYGKPIISYDYRTSKKKDKKKTPKDGENHVFYHYWRIKNHSIYLDCTQRYLGNLDLRITLYDPYPIVP